MGGIDSSSTTRVALTGPLITDRGGKGSLQLLFFGLYTCTKWITKWISIRGIFLGSALVKNVSFRLFILIFISFKLLPQLYSSVVPGQVLWGHPRRRPTHLRWRRTQILPLGSSPKHAAIHQGWGHILQQYWKTGRLHIGVTFDVQLKALKF